MDSKNINDGQVMVLLSISDEDTPDLHVVSTEKGEEMLRLVKTGSLTKQDESGEEVLVEQAMLFPIQDAKHVEIHGGLKH